MSTVMCVVCLLYWTVDVPSDCLSCLIRRAELSTLSARRDLLPQQFPFSNSLLFVLLDFVLLTLHWMRSQSLLSSSRH